MKQLNEIRLARHEAVMNRFRSWELVLPDPAICRYGNGDTLIQWLPENSILQVGMKYASEWSYIYECDHERLYLGRTQSYVHAGLDEICDACGNAGVTGVRYLYDVKSVEEAL